MSPCRGCAETKRIISQVRKGDIAKPAPNVVPLLGGRGGTNPKNLLAGRSERLSSFTSAESGFQTRQIKSEYSCTSKMGEEKRIRLHSPEEKKRGIAFSGEGYRHREGGVLIASSARKEN